MYSDLFLEHFKHPRHVGELAQPAVTVQVENPACGDILRLWARVENGIIGDVRYKVRGCPASIAAGSVTAEWLVGKTAQQLEQLQPDLISEGLGGLEPESKHAAVLCVDGVKQLARQVYTQISARS